MILERQLTNFLFKAADSQVEGSNEIKKAIFPNSPKRKDNRQCVEDIWNQSATIDFGRWNGINFTWEIIPSFIWVVSLYYRWKTTQSGRQDVVKGDHDHLIEVKIFVTTNCLIGAAYNVNNHSYLSSAFLSQSNIWLFVLLNEFYLLFDTCCCMA